MVAPLHSQVSEEYAVRTNPKAFLSLLGVLLLGACADNSTDVTGDASGTYTLVSVSDMPLPYTINQGVESITSGTFTINSDATYSETFYLLDTVSGQASTSVVTCGGTFVQDGGSFDFTETATADGLCGGTYSGTWNGSNTFTVSFFPNFVAFYTR